MIHFSASTPPGMARRPFFGAAEAVHLTEAFAGGDGCVVFKKDDATIILNKLGDLFDKDDVMIDYEKLVARTNPLFERCIRCRAGAHRQELAKRGTTSLRTSTGLALTRRASARSRSRRSSRRLHQPPGAASTAQTLEETYVGLSFDHAPTHPDEHARLRAVGSFIDPTCWLNGGLAISRAISRRLPFDNASITTTTLVVSFAVTVLSTFPVGIAKVLTVTLVTTIPYLVLSALTTNSFNVFLFHPFQVLFLIIHCFFIFSVSFVPSISLSCSYRWFPHVTLFLLVCSSFSSFSVSSFP